MAEGEERPSGGGDDENGKYPIGFRFKPTTEELVEFYLLPKLLGEATVPNEFVVEANAYDFDPEILTEKYKERGVDDDTWYFLSPRYRKYPGGERPVRRTNDRRGRWKPSTGQSKPPVEENASTTSHPKANKKKAALFTENTLAYHVGPTKGETKTKWLMHELVVPKESNKGLHFDSKSAAEPSDDMLLNRYVVCRIYKSPLRKWKEIDEEEAAAEVPTSSQSSSGSAPECAGEEAAARAAPSSSRQPPVKRPAVDWPAASGHTGAPNKGVSVSPTALFPGGGRSAPTRGNGGGSSVRLPVVGAGAGAAGRHGPGLPTLVHWPPVYNSMQGPVQYGYGNPAAGMPNANGQAGPGQGPPPPLWMLRPPHRVVATAPNSLGPQVMMCPPNLAAGQPAHLPSPRQPPPPSSMLRPPHRVIATAPNSLGPQLMMSPPNLAAGQPAHLPSPRQQPPPPPETEEAYRNRVYARLIAEMKLQKAQEGSSARAGQQRIGQTSSAQPACIHDEGGNRPAGVEVMVPPAQFPAPHGSSSNNSLAQRPQRQQSSSAAPAPAAKQSVPPGANEGSCKGDAATIADNIILQILAPNWPL